MPLMGDKFVVLSLHRQLRDEKAAAPSDDMLNLSSDRFLFLPLSWIAIAP